MGWFTNEEVITTNSVECPNQQHGAQSVALCVLAAVAVGYVLVKTLLKLHRDHTVRVAERVARVAGTTSV